MAESPLYAGEQGSRRLHSGFIAAERLSQAVRPIRMKLLHAFLRQSGGMQTRHSSVIRGGLTLDQALRNQRAQRDAAVAALQRRRFGDGAR